MYQLHLCISSTCVSAALVYKLHPQLSSMILKKEKNFTKALLLKNIGHLFTEVHNKLEEI